MATKRKKQKNDWSSWIFIVILFGVGLWPIALIILFSKLFGPDRKQKVAPPSPLQVGGMEPGKTVGSRQTSRAGQAAWKMVRSPQEKTSTARRLEILGIIVAVVGAVMAYEPIDMMIWLGHVDSWYVSDLLKALALSAGGVAMLVAGMRMDGALKRYAKYLAVLGDREAIAAEELARKLGYSQSRVAKDLQKMIEQGYFGGQAYYNMELGYLFRSSQASADMEDQRRKKAEAETQAPPETEGGYSDILRDIRRANDRIADPILSAKIDRLESITASIFKAVEEDPKKRGWINTFLDYYLPTTQKLLDSYASFEAAGVEGENLRQAKERIEKTMDSIVAGFAHQLDDLYKADAMDVDSDIRVMESMLYRDMASAERDFGTARTTQPQQPAAPEAGESGSVVE